MILLLRKTEIDSDVLTMARRRIRNVFANGLPVFMSVSGGKDSICLNDLVYEMAVSGEIDKSLLTVDFVDEEAIYPCVERIVKSMRLQWLSLGVRFRWWCCEFKHFNCFNQLSEDESFITWDRSARWVRDMPKWAITGHRRLRPRVDSYQMFLPRINAHGIQINGLRVAESLQRMNVLADQKTTDSFAYPIYDWRDSDVWHYIAERGLDFPDAYLYMYQCGAGRNQMRISQFFSVDTARSLVRMCEYYPNLFDRICKREPNAYMAMLYFDSEFFRRAKRGKDDTDYKKKVMEYMNDTSRPRSPSQRRVEKQYKNFIVSNSAVITPRVWKVIYQGLVGGDPKGRVYRSLYTHVFQELAKGDVEK